MKRIAPLIQLWAVIALFLSVIAIANAVADDKAAKPAPVAISLTDQEASQGRQLREIQAARQQVLQQTEDAMFTAPLDCEHSLAALARMQTANAQLGEASAALSAFASRMMAKHKVDPDLYVLDKDGKSLIPSGK